MKASLALDDINMYKISYLVKLFFSYQCRTAVFDNAAIYKIKVNIPFAVVNLNMGTKRSEQTVQTITKLLLKEQPEKSSTLFPRPSASIRSTNTLETKHFV